MPFLAPLLPAVAGSLISGMMGQGAAAPAAQSADQSAQAQANMINALVNQYKNVFGPAQSGIMNQLMGMEQGLPINDIVQFSMMQNLLPQMMPDVLRARSEQRVRDQEQRGLQEQMTALGRSGIDPNSPAGQALLNRVREQSLQGLHGVGGQAMEWEANQTLAARDKAYNQALQILGLAGDYSKLGSAMPGTAITGASDLTRLFSQQAQNAASPYASLGPAIGSAMQNYFATPQPYPTPAPQSYQPWLPQPTMYSGATGSNMGMY